MLKIDFHNQIQFFFSQTKFWRLFQKLKTQKEADRIQINNGIAMHFVVLDTVALVISQVSESAELNLLHSGHLLPFEEPVGSRWRSFLGF